MKRSLAVCVFGILLLGGCTERRKPMDIIILPDVSASIDPESRQEMFVAIKDLATHLHRGDSLTIIPITDNADAALSGRTLHYDVPSAQNRQAYDSDLRELSERVSADLSHLAAATDAHPGKYTDILGTIQIALNQPHFDNVQTRLVILSDFIQDDETFNFRKDPRLASVGTATPLGRKTAAQMHARLPTHVLLGRLPSFEYLHLPRERQRAINAFWEAVLPSNTVYSDGVGLLARVRE
jgi:hypothetical protein